MAFIKIRQFLGDKRQITMSALECAYLVQFLNLAKPYAALEAESAEDEGLKDVLETFVKTVTQMIENLEAKLLETPNPDGTAAKVTVAAAINSDELPKKPRHWH